MIVRNRKRNHESLYSNLELSYSANFSHVTDEPYGLKELLKVFLQEKIGFLIIHNCNKWLGLKRTRIHLIEVIRIFLRQAILKRAKGLIFVSPCTKDYFEQNSKNNYSCYYVPFGQVGKYPVENMRYESIVFPGSMNSTKNYNEIYCWLQVHRGNKIKVEFLGVPTDKFGEFWQSKFRDLSNPDVEVQTYSEYIDISLFNAILTECDVLYVDFPEELETEEGYIEVYGESKETGAPWLAYKFSKPIIVPSYYKLAYPKFEITKDQIF
jgi:hypothetical protein